jgi:hypothetical protein
MNEMERLAAQLPPVLLLSGLVNPCRNVSRHRSTDADGTFHAGRFLVLAAYESWSIPLSVMLVVRLA